MSLRRGAVGPGGVRAAAGDGDEPSSRTTSPATAPGAAQDDSAETRQQTAQTAQTTQQTSIELAVSPRSVALARALVADLLRHHGHEHAIDVASLLTSELVTNAVVHGRTTVGVLASVTGGRLRVEAYDESERLPITRKQWPDATDGRGLLIVASLATAWGYEPRATGKAVWFELAL